jgi:hypothetical protein
MVQSLELMLTWLDSFMIYSLNDSLFFLLHIFIFVSDDPGHYSLFSSITLRAPYGSGDIFSSGYLDANMPSALTVKMYL